MKTRKETRAALRAQRRALPAAQAEDAANRLARLACATHFFRAARRIAAYLPNDGEIDPRPVIARAWASGREVYLPVLRPNRTLAFASFEPDSTLAPNRYGIPEPCAASQGLLAGSELDLVLMPLVAFDNNGNRLGMGGGYYDKTFAQLRRRRYWLRPRLVGLAFDFQRVPRLAASNWDVPLWRCVTDRQVYSFARR